MAAVFRTMVRVATRSNRCWKREESRCCVLKLLVVIPRERDVAWRGFASGSEGPADGGNDEDGTSVSTTKLRGEWRTWVETRLNEMEKQGFESEDAKQVISEELHIPGSGRPTGSDPDSDEQLVEEEPMPDVFVPRQEGFSELGRTVVIRKQDIVIVRPQEAESIDREKTTDAPPRLSPRRVFYPGQTYKPTELSPYSTDPLPIAQFKKKKPLAKGLEALRTDWVGYKNTRYLTQFVSETGKLVPRRVTKLKAKIQRRISSEIKTARCMALLPYDSKLPQFTRRKNPYTKAKR